MNEQLKTIRDTLTMHVLFGKMSPAQVMEMILRLAKSSEVTELLEAMSKLAIKAASKGLTKIDQLPDYHDCFMVELVNEMQAPEMISDTVKQKSTKQYEAVLAGAAKVRRYSNEAINKVKQRRTEGATYLALMEEFNIPSKGSLHYVLNHDYATTMVG